MRADLQAANTVVQQMEIDMMKKDSDLVAQKQEVENLTNIKASLKAKLKDYHAKLEATVARYDEKVQYIEKLEQQNKELAETKAEKITENQVKNRRVTMTLNEQRQELEDARKQLDHAKEKKVDIESELKKALKTQQSLEQTVQQNKKEKEGLKKEFENHRSKCDRHLIAANSQNEKLITANEILQEKLNGKDKKLIDLAQVLKKLEDKIPGVESIEATEKVPLLEKKLNESEETIEQLKSDNRLQKVEIRLAERKNDDQKDRITYLREMYKEEKDKREALESETSSEMEKIEALEKELHNSGEECEKLRQKNKNLQERITQIGQELKEARKDAEKQQEFEARCENLQLKLSDMTKEVERNDGLEKRYNTTKVICLELEDQIKEYERLIEKLESSQERLATANSELKGK